MNNPHIAKQVSSKAACIADGPGIRPYIEYPFTIEGHRYTAWRARDHRGRIYLSEPEKTQAAGMVTGDFVVIEPNIKRKANVNKVWAWDRYQQVADQAGVKLVQLGVVGLPVLRGVSLIETPTFRLACAVLARARAYIGPEGGLHHAAAALDVPAVVIFGGSPSVEATGYPEHVNLGGTDPCGRWSPCEHCKKRMDGITVEMVLKGLQKCLSL